MCTVYIETEWAPRYDMSGTQSDEASRKTKTHTLRSCYFNFVCVFLYVFIYIVYNTDMGNREVIE